MGFTFVRDVGAALLDIVAPARCMGCLREGRWLCNICRQRVPAPALSCIVCGRSRPRGDTCFRCRSRTPLAGLITAGPYGSPLFRRGVRWLKFKGVRAVAPTLAQLVVPHLLKAAPTAYAADLGVLVPIPLHRRRLLQRGFNQSFDITLAVSELTGIPVAELLVRSRSTWAQAKLPDELRADNTKDAFSLARPLPQGKLLFFLVDDVTTSGSTLSAAASTLARAGAKEIWGVAVARG